MRQRSRWKSLWFLIFTFQVESALAIDDDITSSRNVQKSLFSPRMDYNQWKPIGRGDPLKNDPTFDYVPPVLDHVHYWMDPEPHPEAPASSSRENGHKTEILLLGVSSKKPATGSSYKHGQNADSIKASDRRDTAYDSYTKFQHDKSTTFLNHHPNQRVARPNYFPSMTSQIIPSLMSLANQVLDRTVFSKSQNPGMPYTVLMPPPFVTKDPGNNNRYPETLITSPMTQKPFTSNQLLLTKPQHFSTPVPAYTQNGVTVQESHLIYQSSSLGSQKEFEAVPSISWELPSTTESVKNDFLHNVNLTPPKSFMRIQFSPQNYSNKILEASDSNHNINYVTPPPLDESKMTFKGEVSDDNDISDSYVKIEKPQAQVDHTAVEIDDMHHLPIIFPNAEPFRVPNSYPSIDMQAIRDMETMKPPPVTQSPVYTRPTVSLLKEIATNYIGSSSSISNAFVTTPKTSSSTYETTFLDIASEINTLLPETPDVTTIPPPGPTTVMSTTDEMTTLQTLTTDPLFKHYKQPVEPMKGPLYLIIQGHSKVKTYKPAKQIDGIMVQETNEIPYLNDKNIDYTIKHLHGYEKKEDFLKKAENIAKQRQARTGNIQTLKHLVKTGLGAIDFGKEEFEIQKRSGEDLQEAELQVGYEIADSKQVASERYHKGIVEEARKLN